MYYGYDNGDLPERYFCPSCKMPAAKLSGLLQHVESGSCEQSLHEGAIDMLCNDLEKYV